MINKNKWLETIQGRKNEFNQDVMQIDSKKWTNTIPGKNNYSSITKYSFVLAIFITSLLLISMVKNETRKLEKEINVLMTSTKKLNFNLDQAILDHEVLTSPENIELLAKEYLDNSFFVYRKSQIKSLNKNKVINKLSTENKNLKGDIQAKLEKKIKSTKVEIQKLKELYSTPNAIPGELKSRIAKKIENKKNQLSNLYNNPKETITRERVQRWASIQLVKVFLGFPVIGK